MQNFNFVCEWLSKYIPQQTTWHVTSGHVVQFLVLCLFDIPKLLSQV